MKTNAVKSKIMVLKSKPNLSFNNYKHSRADKGALKKPGTIVFGFNNSFCHSSKNIVRKKKY